jgi:BirA family transcriptional regulator, biotin operon repressor / biotin---[acetyl-CoA-carboxylase] ligase
VLTRDDLVQALAAINVTAPVRADEVTGSTNATAWQMAEADAPEWALVSAAHQTDGRGRLGRRWVDVPDRSRMCSIVLRPRIEPNRAGLLALAAGAALAGAVREESGLPAACKWPNDVLIDGAKVGGILTEASVADEQLRFVVVGTGVNLEPPPDVPRATGIGEVGLRQLLISYLRRLHELYAGRPGSPLHARVRSAWLPLSATVGRLVEAATTTETVVRGRAVGVDDFGNLVVSTDAGERAVAFGEIQHLDADA